MILATCPKCRSQLQAPETLANKRVKCPKCEAQFTVPNPTVASKRSLKVARSVAARPIDTTSPPPDQPSKLLVFVGFGIAGALLLAFVVTVSLVVYFSVRPTKQAENKEVASNASEPVMGRGEPQRLFDQRRPNLEEPARPQSAESAPIEIAPKSLANMDRLILDVAPRQEDDAPIPEVWTGHSASIRGVAFTDDGRFVVSVSGAIEKNGMRKEDNSIRVWDARRGRQLHKLDNFREALDAVSVSPGGRFAVFGHGGHYERGRWVDSIDHRVHLWDIQDNKEIYFRKDAFGRPGIEQAEARFAGLDSSVFSTAFSPDREKVVGVANSGKLIVWETQSGQSMISGKVEAATRQRDDEGLLRPVSFTLKGINCIRFTPDGRWLVTAGGDYMVRLFDAATGQQLHSFESHQDIVWAVAVSRTKEGHLLGLSGGGSRQRVRGSGFVRGARDYAIRLWDIDSRKEIRRFVGHERDVMSLTFRPNGRHFLSAGMDQTVRLWDVASGKLLRTYSGHTDQRH
jgi:WD40 repeat protein